jgi:S-phase kinase-associated protein 1
MEVASTPIRFAYRSLSLSLSLQLSKEGETFEVTRKVAMMSKLVKDTTDDDEDEEDDGETKEIPLPNVTAPVLKKVIEYCQHYQEEPMTPIQTPLKSSTLDELVQSWYATFVKVDRNMLFDLVAAANFMDIKPLLDLTCLAVSILIKGKSAAELRQMFNISNELSAEETAETTEAVVPVEAVSDPPANAASNSV